jgi:hypothetical protein
MRQLLFDKKINKRRKLSPGRFSPSVLAAASAEEIIAWNMYNKSSHHPSVRHPVPYLMELLLPYSFPHHWLMRDDNYEEKTFQWPVF